MIASSPTVAHIVAESGSSAGAQRRTLLIVNGLRQAGYRAELICGPGGRLIDEARNAGVPVHVVGELARGADARRDARALLRLYAFFRSGLYDIVHTHSTKAGLLGRLAAWLAGVPVIVHTVDAAPSEVRRGVKRAIFIALERLAAALTDRLVCVGEAVRQQVTASGMAPAAKLVTLQDSPDVASGASGRTARDLARLYDGLLASRRASEDDAPLWEVLRRI